MIYLHLCSKCGEVEHERKMQDKAPTKCPQCHKSGLERVYQISFQKPVDMFQENENKGAGKWYPELGPRFKDAKTKKILNQDAYARSQNDAIEKFTRKGVSVSKA